MSEADDKNRGSRVYLEALEKAGEKGFAPIGWLYTGVMSLLMRGGLASMDGSGCFFLNQEGAALLARWRSEDALPAPAPSAAAEDRQRTPEEEELEQLRVQLAGCGVAALGWSPDGQAATPDMYGWSPSYADVLKLRRAFDKISGGRSPDEILEGSSLQEADAAPLSMYDLRGLSEAVRGRLLGLVEELEILERSPRYDEDYKIARCPWLTRSGFARLRPLIAALEREFKSGIGSDGTQPKEAISDEDA